MKKIKLTEATLKRIIERVVKEQEKDDANEQLRELFKRKGAGEDVDKEIEELLRNNPHLKALQGALTPKGKQEIKKAENK